MKKLRKNKFVVLTIIVIVISAVYFVAQKAIDNYYFYNNSDIVTDEKSSSNSEGEGSVDGKNKEGNFGKITKDSSGEILNEEIDLVLEETEGDTNVGEATMEGDVLAERSEASGNADKNIEENKIYVYITGEVNNPGVVILNEGSRIVDAINSAGGTTSNADISKINLVYVLEDGMKINIPNNSDLKNNPNFEYITMNSGDGVKDDYLDGSNSSGEESNNSKKHSIVNINTATQTELETLPGIGPSLALKIINYRKENGKFSTIDEIKNVNGIGEAKFENLKKNITI